jgi:hypothetical protein
LQNGQRLFFNKREESASRGKTQYPEIKEASPSGSVSPYQIPRIHAVAQILQKVRASEISSFNGN